VKTHVPRRQELDGEMWKSGSFLRNVFHIRGTEMITYPPENTGAFEWYSNNTYSGKESELQSLSHGDS